ncbi:hypothetical protein HBI83_259720 [Parastagonospora nodorum]|nr:hypothetical protein HBI83_259720 [Parastagonospora nodorum]
MQLAEALGAVSYHRTVGTAEQKKERGWGLMLRRFGLWCTRGWCGKCGSGRRRVGGQGEMGRRVRRL